MKRPARSGFDRLHHAIQLAHSQPMRKSIAFFVYTSDDFMLIQVSLGTI